MFDTIGFIASVLGIIGAIVATVQFVFKPYLKRRQQYKEIKNIVDDRFKKWKEYNYSIRGGSMIDPEDFLLVNKYRSKFTKLDEEMKAFILRNSIQNGLSGDWGSWLIENKDNDKIIIPLIISLDESSGLRPVWRSSIILEKLFNNSPASIYNYIPASFESDPRIKSTIKIIEQKATNKELNRVFKSNSSENKKKAQMVIKELEIFSKKVDEFMKEQTIIRPDAKA